MYNSSNPDVYEYIDQRGPLAAVGIAPEEVFANAFAAALLMPEHEVRQRHEAKASPAEMAFDFQVSQEAISYRLENLGLVSSARR